jgi:hypothetical protein
MTLIELISFWKAKHVEIQKEYNFCLFDSERSTKCLIALSAIEQTIKYLEKIQDDEKDSFFECEKRNGGLGACDYQCKACRSNYSFHAYKKNSPF